MASPAAASHDAAAKTPARAPAVSPFTPFRILTSTLLIAILSLQLHLLLRPTPPAPPADPLSTPCNPTHDAHCWGLTVPYPLPSQGPRNRTQLSPHAATLLMLVRPSELTGALSSLRQIEDRFNRHHRYPWTFLSDTPFTPEFMHLTSIYASGDVSFGILGSDEWSIPPHINITHAHRRWEQMAAANVHYANSSSYRKMCRWYSGFFARNPLLQNYRWYWRVEPDIAFPCDLWHDPFAVMQRENRKLGFVITLPDYPATVAGLWNATRAFVLHKRALGVEVMPPDNALGFLVDDPARGLDAAWTRCHFWSNFEIGDLEFFRSELYTEYFEWLDREGGFFYERWGDAPVHSLAAALFLSRSEVRFWGEVGYRHVPFGRCPWDDESYLLGRCVRCEWTHEKSFDWHGYSCLQRWLDVNGWEREELVAGGNYGVAKETAAPSAS